MLSKFLLFFFLFVTANLISCASGDVQSQDSPEALFARAKELESDERNEEAIMKFHEVKNRFPYSSLATEAELAAANISFKEENFPEAQASYQIFRDLHPKHPKIDFVIHRIALSLYRQIPPTIDRDLTIAQTAIEFFDDLIANYPQSEHVAEAREKRLECQKKLAEKELYIVNFYLKKQKWESALGRVTDLLASHKGHGVDELALARGVLAARLTSKSDLSEKYLARLNQEFPGSRELDEVTKKYSPL